MLNLPNVSAQLNKIYCDFESDAKELTPKNSSLPLGFKEIATSPRPTSEEKIKLFTNLKQENKKVEALLNNKNPEAAKP